MADTFDRDLEIGVEGEEVVLTMIRRTYKRAFRIKGEFKGYDIFIPEIKCGVEIKTDYKSIETGNYIIEVMFGDKLSALMTTTADRWVIYDGEQFVFIKPERIKDCIIETKPKFLRFTADGDAKEKDVYLIPRSILIDYSSRVERI